MKSKRRATPSKSNSGDDFTPNCNAKIARRAPSSNGSPQVVPGHPTKTTPPLIASPPRDTASITRNKVLTKDKGLLSGKKGAIALAKTSGKLGRKNSTEGENVSRETTSPKGRRVAGRVKDTSNNGASSNAKSSRDFHKENDEESDKSEQDENDADEMEESDDEDEEISLGHRSKSSSTGRDSRSKSRAKGLEDDDNKSDEEEDLDGEESEQDVQSFMQAFPGMSSDEDEKEEDEVEMEEDEDDQHDESDSDHEEEDEDEGDGSGLMKASSSPSIVLVRCSIN